MEKLRNINIVTLSRTNYTSNHGSKQCKKKYLQIYTTNTQNSSITRRKQVKWMIYYNSKDVGN